MIAIEWIYTFLFVLLLFLILLLYELFDWFFFVSGKSFYLVLIKNLNAVFEFYIDSVYFKITSPETKSNLEEENLYNLNDVDYSNKKINNYKDSNINISISDYPFNFFLQRKEDGAILFNSDCAGKRKKHSRKKRAKIYYFILKIIFNYVQKRMKIHIFLD